MKTLQLDILTPSRHALSVACENVYLPADDGEIGVLESHEDYVTLLGTGVVRIATSTEPSALCVRGGFLEVSHDHITLLADEVKFAKEINKSELDAKLEKVESNLVSSKDDVLLQAYKKEKKKWLETQKSFVQ